jgi:hypothetical protein
MRRLKHWIALGSIAYVTLCCACASQSSEETLKRRIAALEQKVANAEQNHKTRSEADESRRLSLEQCVTVEADQKYWDYVKLNGKPVPGKPGTYSAAMDIWRHAEELKRDKIRMQTPVGSRIVRDALAAFSRISTIEARHTLRQTPTTPRC